MNYAMEPKIVIIDYDLGNLFSVEKACRYLHIAGGFSNNTKEILDSDGIILPGVGAFGDGMNGLKKYGLVEGIKDFALSGRPILGICLGMQFLMSYSEEFGVQEGLDLIKGGIKCLPKERLLKGDLRYKVPHIGWNGLYLPDRETVWEDTVLEGLNEGTEMYFVHSFSAVPDDRKNILAVTNYGGISIVAAVRRDNIYGCQFHPEKSREIGLRILKNFSEIVVRFRERGKFEPGFENIVKGPLEKCKN